MPSDFFLTMKLSVAVKQQEKRNRLPYHRLPIITEAIDKKMDLLSTNNIDNRSALASLKTHSLFEKRTGFYHKLKPKTNPKTEPAIMP
jgi:hypothetical protein